MVYNSSIVHILLRLSPHNAHEVYIARHAALIGNDAIIANNDNLEQGVKRARLSKLAALCSYVSGATKRECNIFDGRQFFFN